ncbi:MAG: hypothetical protein AAFN30_04420 [Actinomycetota bacterium]
MQFVGRFARLSVVVVLALALMVVFAYALASAFLLPPGGLGPQIAAEESPATTAAASEEAPTEAVPDPGLPATQAPPISGSANSSMATVSCQREAGRPTASEPFALRIGRTEPGPDPITVAVDLVLIDGARERRTVESAVLAADGSLEIGVPDSIGASFVDCLVVAIQRGDRVVYTGN